MSDYPEHDKVRAIKDQSQAIHSFVEWLGSEKGIHLSEWVPVSEHSRKANLEYTPMRTEDLVAEFFEIDLKKFHAEKDQMVEEMQRQNEARRGNRSGAV